MEEIKEIEYGEDIEPMGEDITDLIKKLDRLEGKECNSYCWSL